MEEVIEAEAATIDPPARPTPAEAWLAETGNTVGAIAAEFPVYEIEDAEGYRQMKRDRAALRKRIAAIDAERKDMTAEVELAVREFREGARHALEPLTSIDAAYAERVHGFERELADQRMETLRTAYEEQCEQIATVVPFDVLAERFAKAGKWTSASTTENDALMDLYAHVRDIGTDEERVIHAPFDSPEEREAARSHFFETLDVGETLAWVSDRREALARLAELDESRAWRPERPQEAPRSDETQIVDNYTATTETDAQNAPELLIYRVEVPRERNREFIDAMRALGDVHGRRIHE